MDEGSSTMTVKIKVGQSVRVRIPGQDQPVVERVARVYPRRGEVETRFKQLYPIGWCEVVGDEELKRIDALNEARAATIQAEHTDARLLQKSTEVVERLRRMADDVERIVQRRAVQTPEERANDPYLYTNWAIQMVSEIQNHLAWGFANMGTDSLTSLAGSSISAHRWAEVAEAAAKAYEEKEA